MAQIPGPYLFQAYYQTLKTVEAKRIWWALVKSKNMYTRLPMHTEEALLKVGHRVIDNLPTTETVYMGQEPTDTFYQPSKRFEEPLTLWRKNWQIDEQMTKVKNQQEDPVKFNSKAYLLRLSYDMDNYLINQSPVQGPIMDPKAPSPGLKYRIVDTSGPNGTSIWGVNPACNVQSVGTQLNTANWSSTNSGRLFLDFDHVLSHMDSENGDGIICYVASQVKWLIDALIRTGSPNAGFSIDRDVFNRTIVKYKEMEIAECTFLPPNPGGLQVTPVISVSDDAAGWGPGDPLYNPTGTTYFTSFYFVKRSSSGGMGQGGGLVAWQNVEVIQRFERVTGQRQMFWMHDQSTGLFYEDTRAIARLYGVQVQGPAFN